MSFWNHSHIITLSFNSGGPVNPIESLIRNLSNSFQSCQIIL
uniref:Uncharacterized protein n=1 Tax=Heterorhabditis bacteriophora TaxID=37862 RepID=A0A1I7WGC0_HETBA